MRKNWYGCTYKWYIMCGNMCSKWCSIRRKIGTGVYTNDVLYGDLCVANNVVYVEKLVRVYIQMIYYVVRVYIQMIYYCVVICSSGKLQRDLQAPSNSLTFAQTCPNMLKFAQICSNLLKFGELQRDLQAPSNVQAKSRACSSWLFFFWKKMTGQENRTQSWLPPQIRGGGATRRTNCCVSPKLYWNGAFCIVWKFLVFRM